MFGKLISGVPVLRSIENVDTSLEDRPTTEVKIVRCGDLEILEKLEKVVMDGKSICRNWIFHSSHFHPPPPTLTFFLSLGGKSRGFSDEHGHRAMSFHILSIDENTSTRLEDYPRDVEVGCGLVATAFCSDSKRC